MLIRLRTRGRRASSRSLRRSGTRPLRAAHAAAALPDITEDDGLAPCAFPSQAVFTADIIDVRVLAVCVDTLPPMCVVSFSVYAVFFFLGRTYKNMRP